METCIASLATAPTHCEYPSTEPSDNGGPHGLHTIGQIYVHTHIKAGKADPSACTVCHGKDYRGTALSKTFAARSFTTTGRYKKTYAKGDIVGCYDCHDGPGEGELAGQLELFSEEY